MDAPVAGDAPEEGGDAGGIQKRPAAAADTSMTVRLQSLAVPPALWPAAGGKGQHSYTVHDPHGAGVRLEVLLRSQSYYVRAVHPNKATRAHARVR